MNNVYLDLNKSPFFIMIGDLKMVFSSERYLEIFKRDYQEYVKTEILKFHSKYKNIIENLDLYFLIIFYRKIEKRGFKVFYKNKEIFEDVGFDLLICD